MDAALSSSPTHAHSSYVHDATKLRTGMLLLMSTDIVFVGCLFVAYLYLHSLNVEAMWLPKGIHMPSAQQNTIMTAALVVSSGFYAWGLSGIRRERQGQLKAGITLAVLSLIGVLVAQVWQLAHLGFMPGSGGFASAFIGLSGYHTVHLILATVVGLMVMNRVLNGLYTQERHVAVEIVGYLWYWVSAMAVLMWLAMTFS